MRDCIFRRRPDVYHYQLTELGLVSATTARTVEPVAKASRSAVQVRLAPLDDLIGSLRHVGPFNRGVSQNVYAI